MESGDEGGRQARNLILLSTWKPILESSRSYISFPRKFFSGRSEWFEERELERKKEKVPCTKILLCIPIVCVAVPCSMHMGWLLVRLEMKCLGLVAGEAELNGLVPSRLAASLVTVDGEFVHEEGL